MRLRLGRTTLALTLTGIMRLRLGRTTLALTLTGALLIGLGLSYFVAMTEDTRYEITETIAEHWRTDYDIVVRPWPETPLAVDVIERERDLIESNYLSSLPGGITHDDWVSIKGIPGVEVAAPLAVCGQLRFSYTVRLPVMAEDRGIYRVDADRVYLGGPEPLHVSDRHYVGVGRVFSGYGGFALNARMPAGYPLSWREGLILPIVGVDPDAEEQLVGLARATSGHYLSQTESGPEVVEDEYGTRLRIPTLLRETPAYRFRHQLTISRLPLEATPETVRLLGVGGRQWLDQFQAEPIDVCRVTDADVLNGLLEEWFHADQQHKSRFPLDGSIGPLNYRVADEGSLTIEPTGWFQQPGVSGEGLLRPGYRVGVDRVPAAGPWVETGGRPVVEPYVLGLFEVDRLDLLRDPLTMLPMETYRPARGLLTADPNGVPLREPVDLTPTGNPQGLLTCPPMLLTTLEAARMLYGDDCISAIRVRVEGARDMSLESRRRIEWVAKEIQARTGLRVDVTAGSSPTQESVYVAGMPPIGDYPAVEPLGYVDLPFVKKNVHITIVNELSRGNVVILGAVLLVAVLYVLTHAAAMVYARLRDMAVCRALGWRPGQVLWDTVSGALIFGGFAALVGVGLSVFLADWGDLYVPWARFVLVGGSAIAVYAAGSLVPGWYAGRVSPMLAMTAGEAGGRTALTPRGIGGSHRVRITAGVFGLILGALLARWKRYLLTLVCLIVSTAMLATFLLVTLRLQGIMCGSLLGQFLILEIGPRHLLTAVLCLGLTGVALAEIVGLNVAERQGEFRLLSALGWRPLQLQLMVAAEGAVLGALGGLLSICLACWALGAAYGISPHSLVITSCVILPVPVSTGFIGAMIPAVGIGRPTSGTGLRRL